MTLIKKFCSFLNYVFSYFANKQTTETSEMEEDVVEQFVEETETEQEEDRVSVAKRTLMTKLYMLEQEITVFEIDFPKEHETFMERIEMLRDSYNSSLEEKDKLLTFEIDPEFDSTKLWEVEKLEMDIKKFIDSEVKFQSISKHLQRMIMKLNILYNVSIFHSKESEKEKVISQLKHALESARKIADEFKECDYILNDNQLKERIVNLISYVDYEIFKTSIRNSNESPDKLTQNLVMTVEFKEFDYTTAFIAFIKDEISDLGELLPLIPDEEYRRIFEEKLTSLLTNITYVDNDENQLYNPVFWDDFLNFESSLLEMLKDSGVEKEKIKVSLIVRMDINVNESEVLILPKTNAYLSLITIYSITKNKKIWLLIKLFKHVSDEITYKEIYFLILLFDALEVVKNTKNGLFRHIEKYFEKYPYEKTTIMEKKKSVINSYNKEYVFAFKVKDYEEYTVPTLEELNIDFKIVDDNVLINSFYFGGLKNVVNSLQNNKA